MIPAVNTSELNAEDDRQCIHSQISVQINWKPLFTRDRTQLPERSYVPISSSKRLGNSLVFPSDSKPDPNRKTGSKWPERKIQLQKQSRGPENQNPIEQRQETGGTALLLPFLFNLQRWERAVAVSTVQNRRKLLASEIGILLLHL
eukprot:c28179_g1_i1 orf=234-671(-)